MTNEEIKLWYKLLPSVDRDSVTVMRITEQELQDLLTTYRAQVLEEVMQIAKEKRQEVFNTVNDPKNILCPKCRENITHGSICYTQGNCPKHPTN